MPACTRRSSVAISLEAGPIVATILVRRMAGNASAPCRSGCLELGEVLGDVTAQDVAYPPSLLRGGHAVAGQQIPLALDGQPGDHPPDGQALEQEFGGALPGIFARERRPARHQRIFTARR